MSAGLVAKLIEPSLLEQADVGWEPSLSKERSPHPEMGPGGRLYDDGYDLYVVVEA